MKISFDVQLLMNGEKTGIGWCADNILRNVPHTQGNMYQLNCFSLRCNKEQLQNIEVYSQWGYYIKKCPWFYNTIYRLLSVFFYIPYQLFFGDDSDITMFFNYIVPPGVKGKKVVMIYDMVYKVYPETMRKRTLYMLNKSLIKSCNRADKIITISEFSKQEIIKCLGIEKDKIVVMPVGVDTSIYHPYYKEEEICNVTEKYKLPREYMLYLGTLEPRKNLERLIQAYSLLKKEIPCVPKLVMAGGKGWMYEGIFETVKALQIEKDIIFTGYIKPEDSPILMRGAKMFLFPSLYEGFGMPPLEAMACGTPVLVSNAASLPEVVGDAGLQVDPFSIDDIKNGIKLLIEDENKRSELSLKGIERAKLFTWDKSVEIVQKVFEEIQ
ncbi:MAG: glycosyltransferase family 4 protein [Clostridiaceae bacterium]|nr:glycosyltransferase family 4 protein [Clostridiaceae bacterium]